VGGVRGGGLNGECEQRFLGFGAEPGDDALGHPDDGLDIDVGGAGQLLLASAREQDPQMAAGLGGFDEVGGRAVCAGVLVGGVGVGARVALAALGVAAAVLLALHGAPARQVELDREVVRQCLPRWCCGIRALPSRATST